MMKYVIGVDGGGTKTEAVAYNLNDEPIVQSRTGPSNPALNYSEAEANIKEAIYQCIHHINTQGIQGECCGIYLGIAGIEVGDNKNMLEISIGNAFGCNVTGLHDSELAHAAILEGQDGIITISGTGSVSYGRFHGMTAKTGGWGHVLGDEGSGYWIALAAMKRMTEEQDSGFSPSNLSRAIMEVLGVSSVDGMKDFVHASGKYQIADLSKAVVQLAEAGDTNAADILNKAGFELAFQTIRLYRKLNLNGPAVIGISGGILRNVPPVRDQFRICLEKELEFVKIVGEDISPTKGACYLYRLPLGKWDI